MYMEDINEDFVCNANAVKTLSEEIKKNYKKALVTNVFIWQNLIYNGKSFISYKRGHTVGMQMSSSVCKVILRLTDVVV